MNLSHYVKFTCWTSIAAILWLRMLESIPNNWSVWLAFAFFCVVGVIAYAMDMKK